MRSLLNQTITILAIVSASILPVRSAPPILTLPEHSVTNITTPVSPIVINPPTSVQSVTLTAEGRQFLQKRMARYAKERASKLPSEAALVQSGISKENDAIEKAWLADGRRVVPNHIGKAGSSNPPMIDVDPVAINAARAVAQQRLGREPTESEITAALSELDVKIAHINQEIAQRRGQIAAIYKQNGKFPRDVEAPILGIQPRTENAVNPDATTRLQLQRLFTKLSNEYGHAEPNSLIPPLRGGKSSSPQKR